MRATVEICVEGVVSAIEAGAGGADRIELCENLAVGGVTPSSGSIWVAKRAGPPIHVLVRPRGGDFLYKEAELEVIQRDVEAARMLGASGVVLGLLDAKGRVDRRKTASLVKIARPMSVTFHKAFDATRDPLQALDDLIALGVDRVLTSGHAPTAREGLPLLAELTRHAAGRIAVMAGGSIRVEDVRPLIDAGVREIHAGSAACRGGEARRDLVAGIVRAASPRELFHILPQADWERALARGTYLPDSFVGEGFIHGSTGEQVEGSANRFFRGRSGLVVLRVATERLRCPLSWAKSPDSESPFPHIHGPIDLDAVLEVVPLEPGGEGSFRWPAQPGGGRGTS